MFDKAYRVLRMFDPYGVALTMLKIRFYKYSIPLGLFLPFYLTPEGSNICSNHPHPVRTTP
jgi:hypothetical protein